MKKHFFFLLIAVISSKMSAMVTTASRSAMRSISFYLFRFDLRIRDNSALIAAVQRSKKEDYFVSTHFCRL